MTEETRRAFGLGQTGVLIWQGERYRKTRTFLLVAGVAIMILLGTNMLAGAAIPQYGGRRMRRPMTPEQQLARMTKQLNLTKEQQAKIKPILEEQQKQMMALRQDSSMSRQDSSMSRQDRFAKFREIRKQMFDKIHPILNADQQKQLQQQMERMRPGRRGGPQRFR